MDGDVKVLTFLLFSFKTDKIVWTTEFLPSSPNTDITFPEISIFGSNEIFLSADFILDKSKFILRVYLFCSFL